MINQFKSICGAAILATAVPAAAVFGQGSAALLAIDVPAGADVLFTVPFNNSNLGDFEIDSLSGSDTLNVPAASFGDIDGDHYIRLLDGSAAGLWATVASNSGTSITISDQDVIDRISAGDSFRLYPHTTVNDVFPPAETGLSHELGTEVFLFQNTGSSTGVAPQGSVEFVSQTFGGQTVQFWIGGPNGLGGGEIIEPLTRAIVRNTGSNDLTLYLYGETPDHPISLVVPAGVNADFVIGGGFPVTQTANELGLGGVLNREIFVFDNDAATTNKAPIGSIEWIEQTFGSTTVQFWFGGPGNEGGALEIVNGETITFRVDNEPAEAVISLNKPY